MTEQRYSMELDNSDTERFTLTVGEPCADKPMDENNLSDWIIKKEAGETLAKYIGNNTGKIEVFYLNGTSGVNSNND